MSSHTLAVAAAVFGVACGMHGAAAFAPLGGGVCVERSGAQPARSVLGPARNRCVLGGRMLSPGLMPCIASRGHGSCTKGLRLHSDQAIGRGRRSGPHLSMNGAKAGDSGDSLAPGPQQGGTLNALYKFTRPHTIRGTILASCACVTRAMLKCIEQQPVIEWKLLKTAFFGLVALLCGNAYIVGINQIYDVEIDKVNKPFLPMAAGEISKPLAWGLVCGTGALGLAIVYHFFSALICQLYCVGMVLGTVYTVPPFRWKNNPALAAFSIAMVRGLLLNIGLHHAASTALGLAITWPAQVLFISAFMTVFATVIAIAKDLPDVAGDIKFGVKTLASSLGVDKAAHLVTLALMGNYVMGVGVGLLAPGIQNRALMVVAHAGLAGWLAVFASRLQPDSIKSIKLFYRNIWKLFYVEYLLYPFI